MGMPTPSTVDEYLDSLPEGSRAVLERLRTVIRAAAPEATEEISYQMPALRYRGRFLVSYAAYKDHFSLFPASGAVQEGLGEELTPFLSGKGTIRFTAENAIPDSLVRKVVRVRLAEIEAG
jgi:uncharacterized protein YdhG (YjbR/CyaY superfamily)